MRRQVSVVLAALLVSAPIVGAAGLGVDAERRVAPVPAQGGDDHPPIRIHGDEQFLLPSSGVTGGSGTADDPYVIEGWTVRPLKIAQKGDDPDFAQDCTSPMDPLWFTSGTRWHGIEIVDTSAHVIIENVSVVPRTPRTVPGEGPDAANVRIDSEDMIGILLRDADHVTIRNVTVGQPSGLTLYRGICAKDSDNLRIQNSTVQNTKGNDAIEITRGSDVTLTENVLRDGRDIVEAIDVSSLRIARNHVVDGAEGVALSGVTDSVVHRNTIQDHGGIGIHMGVDPTGVTVTANIIKNNGNDGIRIDSGSNVAIHDNNIVGNGDTGLQTDIDVDATNNWWGADSGPSGGVTDDCTGTEANGAGQEIRVDDGADVCFDPWLTSPNPDAGA